MLENVIAFLQEILRLESYTHFEQALAARVVQEMQHLGFDAAWLDPTGNALGLVRGREHGAATMLLTHLDHIAVGDLSMWKHPPFDGVLEDGQLYGRGAVYCKLNFVHGTIVWWWCLSKKKSAGVASPNCCPNCHSRHRLADSSWALAWSANPATTK
jgi:hypothetical protein